MITEAKEQENLFRWAAYQTAVYPELQLLFHIGNEGNRGGKYGMMDGARNKAQGVKAGVPDLFFPVPRGGFHGLFIEMKRADGGRVSEDQRGWLEALRRQGYMAVVCKGFDAAKNVLIDYLRG